MSFYNRDERVPYWRANVDVDSLFDAHAHRPDRAQAWLKFRDVSECSVAFEQAVLMRGHFEGGILGSHTYHWTFTPTYKGDLAVVLPIYDQARIVDLLAMSRLDCRIWGCCTGAGQYVGEFSSRAREDRTLPLTLHVHDTPYSWLMSDCDGVLPLAKAFFPLMQFAHNIIAQDAQHAWEIAHRAFVHPAERFGLDANAAEQAAFDRISFAEEAA
jgi:hypothetical protein